MGMAETTGQALCVFHKGGVPVKIVRKAKKTKTEKYVEISELEQKKRDLMKKKRKNRAKRRVTVLMFLIICVGIIFAIFKAPFFNVKTVFCVGQQNMAEAEIVKLADVHTGGNIFSVNLRAVKKRLDSNPMIAEANVRRIFPNKIKIWVKEAKMVAYVEKDGKFLMLDQNGQIIKTLKAGDENTIPKAARLAGIEIVRQKPGENVAESDDQRAIKLFECMGNLTELEMMDKVSYINFEDLSDIEIDYESRLFMLLGSYEKLDYKLKFVKKVIDDNISEYEKALFDYRGDKLYVGPREEVEENESEKEDEAQNEEPSEEKAVENVETESE